MRYPTGLENLIRTATLAASNTLASSAWELVSRSATGGGTVQLGGSYTGADDATVDIEIISSTINGAPRISTPVYAGVGNGAIVNIAADSGIAAQVFTVTVLDAGTPTRQAWAPFQSVNLRAINAGSAGNDLSIRVSQAGLTATATDYAVTADIPAATSELIGDQWNFGAPVLEPEGTVPTSAPRLRFGDDPTVYRHWRTFREGRYRYHFSPSLQRAVPVGTRVYAITGGRTVSVYDGETEAETFSAVTTLYSLLSQIAASSALIEVDGVIANDRRPGGMACDDLSVHTASYSAGSTRGGTPYIERALVTLSVPATAPTETLRLECIGAQIPGAEIWRLSGTVSDDLGTVTSGESLTAGSYTVTVPEETAPNTAPAGTHAAWLELLTRNAQATLPSLCVRNFRLGAEAQETTWTFEWQPRPGAECPCDSVPVVGGPNPDLLGIEDEEAAVATLPATLKTLYEQVEDWRLQSLHLNCYFTATDDDAFITAMVNGINAIIQSNTVAPTEALTSGIATLLFQRASAIAKFEQADIDAIELVANMFQRHLLLIYAEKGGTGDLDEAIADEFQTQWDFMVDKLSPLMVVTNDGGLVWKTTAFSQLTMPTEAATDPLAVIEGYVMRAIQGTRNLTSDLGPLTRMAQACIGKVYIAADLLRPFDSATPTGNSVWQDQGGDHWFASLDGLLPIQPGYYYHSARMEADGDGTERPVATRDFGIGVAIGCPEQLRNGDKLLIRTTPFGNARSTYQQGDYIEWEIVRADPVALGGGQTGDDTITFGVRGSVVGALANYELVTTAPAGYDDGGLSFTIEPGGIDFQPGDRWTFSAEGGEFRWRIDGGGWTTADIGATVALSSGITAVFTAGATPSWVTGDTYQLTMLATSGAGRARKPDDESMEWATSTQIDITPADNDPADTLLIAAHSIPSDAVVALTGSNDNWATTAFSQVVPWSAGSMALLFDSTTCAKWRLTVDDAGTIGWLYLGTPERPIVSGTDDTVEHGIWRRRMRMATGQRSRAIGGQIAHTDCDQASVDALLEAFEYAHEYDDSRVGVVSPEGEGALCVVDTDIDLEDAYGFQPPTASRRVGFSLNLTPR
jgi:hypothetical protein